MDKLRHTFNKNERLCSRSIIQILVKSKNSVFSHPFLLAWVETTLPEKVPAQVMISVSRKKFPKAHDRNYCKRVLREYYRHNKHLIYKTTEGTEKQLALFLTITTTQMPAFETGKIAFDKLIKKLVNELEKHRI